MTYAKGSAVQAADLNTLIGLNNSPAVSAAGAQNKAGYLWGKGFGDRGYGQISPTLPLSGSVEPMMKCASDGNGAGGQGGFVHSASGTVATTAYRMTQWVYLNKTSTGGRVYFGTGSSTGAVNMLTGAAEGNPYWIYYMGDGIYTASNIGPVDIKRHPVPGEWYLLVGIIQGSGYAGTGYGSGLSGIYDMAGNQIVRVADVKQQPGSTAVTHRSFLYYSSDATQLAYIARPRCEAMTGSEPSIASLIAMTGAQSGQPTTTLINPTLWRNGDTSMSAWNTGSNSWAQNAALWSIVPSVLGGIPEQTTSTSSNIASIRSVMSSLAAWQNTATTLLPSVGQTASGSTVQAFPTGQTPSMVDMLALLDTNRLNYQAGNMALTASAATTTRGSAWGSGAGQIACEFSVQFASEDAARYFFNTGGEVRVALSHPNTSTPQNTTWNTVLSNSNFAFRANSSARLTGSYGTAQAVGYYQLTTAYQTIINGIGAFTSPYSSNSFLVEARSVSIIGANGAKGSQIYFRVTLADSFTSAFSDTVASGTVATVSHLRANAVLPVLPAAPSCTVVTAF